MGRVKKETIQGPQKSSFRLTRMKAQFGCIHWMDPMESLDPGLPFLCHLHRCSVTPCLFLILDMKMKSTSALQQRMNL